MSALLDTLKEKYDCIIIDLPNVCEVSDAMVACRLCDGMILVARKDCTKKPMFAKAVAQIEFAGAKILGIAFNCIEYNA